MITDGRRNTTPKANARNQNRSVRIATIRYAKLASATSKMIDSALMPISDGTCSTVRSQIR